MSSDNNSRLYKVEYVGSVDTYLQIGLEEYRSGSFGQRDNAFFESHGLCSAAKLEVQFKDVFIESEGWHFVLCFGLSSLKSLIGTLFGEYLSILPNEVRDEYTQELIRELVKNRTPSFIDPNTN